jgi:cytoskeletal protein CcmA (bactofilin family)
VTHEAHDVDDNGEYATAHRGPCVIAAGTTIRGEIDAVGDVVVRGRVHGRIVCAGQLSVPVDGVVHADVAVGALRVRGELVGDVVAEGAVELVGSGCVTGDVRAARVVIADGATLRGSVTLLPVRADVPSNGASLLASTGTAPSAPQAPSAVGDPMLHTAPARPVGDNRLLAADGGPPKARGLVEKTHKPRLYVRHVDVARPRSP